ncbi:unnamed protein product [Diamesa hyperborea]
MCSTLNLERTLAIIKPDAICHRFEIMRRIKIAGFHVLDERSIKLSLEQATEFLKHKPYALKFPMHVTYLSTGPIIALCLARTNAVKLWHDLIGPEKHLIAKQSAPTSLRALFGDSNDDFKSAVYGTELPEDVPQELHYFFPNMILEPILCTKDQQSESLCLSIYGNLNEALYEMTKYKPEDPLQWLAHYMLAKNTNKPFMQDTSVDMIEKINELKRIEEEDKLKKSLLLQDNDSNNAIHRLECGCKISNSFHNDTDSL